MTLTIQKSGQLGNQMFQIASLIGIGLSNKVPVVFNHGYDSFRKIFELAKCDYPTISTREEKKYRVLYVPLNIGYDKRFKDIHRHLHSPRTKIRGYVQSFRYFENSEDLMKSCFQFKPEIRQTVSRFLIASVPKHRVTVGIHIRRGDFLRPGAQKRGLSVAKASFFHKAMDLMLNRYPNAFFIVASDDLKWAKQNLGSRAVMTPFTSAQHDLALLASCQHSIISTGSFSWWAGWLSNGTTIYYKNYPRNGSSLFAGAKLSDYYYKHWIPLSD
ncbi:hypothetical protein CAPTEDRAFT_96186 [Capitella teleta]|uniref:L-Fucosyltransferase n=1 Tax=Capitella teleta TaxID=283909 RepID=R7V185_CAPTE|nr:hypothetical protein CAPTEDRAFT_96186 [Capitella teleta]|eukprot:ELU12299.1 hypothetical protein CAPTEDRAFT_96186 [Capitella teleta]